MGALIGKNAGELYHSLLNLLANSGMRVAPRGIETAELLGIQAILLDSEKCAPINSVRNVNYRFMVAEWLWILFGHNELKVIEPYNREMVKFSDDGERLSGAYGPRWFEQYNYLLQAFKEDPFTRQAVMTIWRPNPPPSKDIPCTVNLQFIIRGGKLQCIATMRSSDAWLGFPYDLFCFSQLTNYLAGLLKIARGSVMLQLGSAHLYRHDYEKAVQSLEQNWGYLKTRDLEGEAPTALDDILCSRQVSLLAPTLPECWQPYGEALITTTRAEAYEVLRRWE